METETSRGTLELPCCNEALDIGAGAETFNRSKIMRLNSSRRSNLFCWRIAHAKQNEKRIEAPRQPRSVIIGAVAAMAVVTSLITIWAQTVPQPVLKIAITNGTQILISISNAVASTNYEIYRAPILNDTNFPFEPYIIGSVGQSNFTADIGVDTTGFFKVTIGSDLDNDGFPDWLDANPTDPTIGILSITIDSPTNGASLQ